MSGSGTSSSSNGGAPRGSNSAVALSAAVAVAVAAGAVAFLGLRRLSRAHVSNAKRKQEDEEKIAQDILESCCTKHLSPIEVTRTQVCCAVPCCAVLWWWCGGVLYCGVVWWRAVVWCARFATPAFLIMSYSIIKKFTCVSVFLSF